MNTHTTRSLTAMTQIGLFAAVLAALSQISIPLPSGIPVTLQTFAVALAAYVLGWKRGVCSVGIFLALGAVGIPVFAGFTGGVGKFVGVTGGFLWGFFPLVFCCGIAMTQWQGTRRPILRTVLCVVLSLLGLSCCHLLGCLQFSLVSGNSLRGSFLVASAPYLIKDGLSLVAAYGLALAVKKALSAQKRQQGCAD